MSASRIPVIFFADSMPAASRDIDLAEHRQHSACTVGCPTVGTAPTANRSTKSWVVAWAKTLGILGQPLIDDD